MPTYRGNGAWGTGKGANLTAAEFDGNTYEFDTRITALETDPVQPANIASATWQGNQLTFHRDDGVDIGPITVPVPMPRWRGEWQPSTLYAEMDFFTVGDADLYVSLQAHTSDTVFDSGATGGSPATALYQHLIGLGLNTITLDDLSDVAIAAVAAGDFLVYGGSPASWYNATAAAATALLDAFVGDTGSPSNPLKGLVPAPAVGDAAAEKYLKADGTWATIATGASALDDLTDVAITSPADGEVLTYQAGSPTGWVNAPIPAVPSALDDLTDVSAPSPSDGQVLTYQAGSPTGWIAGDLPATPTALNDLTDVSAPSPADGDILQYSAGSPAGWANAAGSAISDLPAVALGSPPVAINSASLIEISEASGSPLTYTSKRATLDDLFTEVTFAGTTTWPGGTNIDSGGQLAIGGSGFDARILAKSADGTISTQLFSFNGLGGFVGTLTNNNFDIRTNDTTKMRVYSGGDVRVGTGVSLALSATDGFLLIPTTNGIPTGTPTNGSAAQIPIAYNRADGILHAYISGWRGTNWLPTRAFASLPGSPATGEVWNVSDSNTTTWGATIAGGGANNVQARYNGTNWTVVGI